MSAWGAGRGDSKSPQIDFGLENPGICKARARGPAAPRPARREPQALVIPRHQLLKDSPRGDAQNRADKRTRTWPGLAAAKLVAGVFRKWKKLVEIRKEQRQDGLEVTGKTEKSSYVRSFTTASSSMLSVGEKLKLAS